MDTIFFVWLRENGVVLAPRVRTADVNFDGGARQAFQGDRYFPALLPLWVAGLDTMSIAQIQCDGNPAAIFVRIAPILLDRAVAP